MAPRTRAIKIKAAGRGHLTGGKYWKFKEYRARMIALNPVDVNSDDGNRVSNKDFKITSNGRSSLCWWRRG